jgi:acetyl-CoA carboxylase biotin carboxyl carrier protein
MDYTDLEKLVKLVENSSLDEVYYKTDYVEIKLKKTAEQNIIQTVAAPYQAQAPVPVPSAPVNKEKKEAPAALQSTVTEEAAAGTGGELTGVHSPYVGSIILVNDDGKQYVSESDMVKKGQLLCRIEAMKMFNDITSPVDGTVRNILVKNGDMAEYNQLLFEIEEKK